ncbi:MAG: aminopeptidase [Candidatus Omnitrophica bacterium]|nr:aminopeptidase [Candidatus Omnitrophota bacterium]
MDKEIVKTIIKDCFGFKKGEHVLIVCDDKLRMLAQSFYSAVKASGIETVLLNMPARKMHGQEPPKEVASALKAADIAILFTSMSLSHTKARKEASLKFGTRIASLPGITPEIFRRSINLNYSSLRKRAAKIANRLSKGRRLEIYTDKGTHLTMSIRGRKGFSDDGLYTKRGAFGNLPAGEACIAPCEGTAQGVLVVDASAPLVGRIKHPKKIIIKDGFAQNIPFPKISSLIKSLGRCALNIAEFGLGLNPKAKVTGNVLEDEKAKQTAHLAIGANISFGGKIACPCHLDFVFFNPVIFVDGHRLEVAK